MYEHRQHVALPADIVVVVVVVGIGFVHPCTQLQIRVKLLGCKEYTNQEALWVEAGDIERLFICLIQPRLGVGGLYTLHHF
jgi:hypothetical protein